MSFDPLDPPTADNPLPAVGGELSMKLLRNLIRTPLHERTKPLTPEALTLLIEIEAALSASLDPASPGEIGNMLVSLFSHYPVRTMSDAERVSVAKDWLIDLSGVPADIIAAACQEWRRGPNIYAPNPGQLLALINPVLAARRFLHQIAADWVSAQCREANENERSVARGGAGSRR